MHSFLVWRAQLFRNSLRAWGGPPSVTLLALLALLALSLPVGPLAAQQQAPCSAPEYRQFDFWIGEWEVTTPQGQPAGTNSIQPILNGCVLYESWKGASGSDGHSHNMYDRTRGVWHQTWVDNSGLLLRIEGGLKDGKMVLSGETLTPNGPTLQRITWSVEDENGDVVRQLWETSADGGTTWTVAFDGTYRKVK